MNSNVVPLKSRTVNGGMAHVPFLALMYALIIYQCVRPDAERLARITAVIRQGMNSDVTTLEVLVPIEIAGLLDDISPDEIGEAAAILQAMSLGMNVVESQKYLNS